MASIQTFLERIANNYSPEKSTFSVCGWKYFFVVPMIFSGVITICFIFVAWIAGKP